MASEEQEDLDPREYLQTKLRNLNHTMAVVQEDIDSGEHESIVERARSTRERALELDRTDIAEDMTVAIFEQQRARFYVLKRQFEAVQSKRYGEEVLGLPQ